MPERLTELFRRLLLFDRLWLFLAVLFSFNNVFQGLCVGDFGWVLTHYKYFFEHPEFISHNIWLTNLIGGLWYRYVSDTVIGFRILFSLIIGLSSFIAYKYLSSGKKVRFAGFGVFLTVLWINKYCLNWYYYDTLTSLFLLITSIFLLRAVDEEKRKYFYISGFFAGLSVFVRLPNFLVFACLAVCFFRGRDAFREGALNSLRYTAGAAFGIVLCLFAIALMGHWNYFVASIYDVSSALEESKSYSFRQIFFGIWGRVFVDVCSALLFVLIWRNLHFSIFSRNSKLYFFSILLFCLVLHKYLIFWWVFLVPGMVILLMLERYKENQSSAELCYISLLLLITPSFGTNPELGMRNSIYGLWMGFPFLISSVISGGSKLFSVLHENRAVFITGLIYICVYWLPYGIFDDMGSRFSMISAIEHPKLKYTFTSPQRAMVFEKLLVKLNEMKNFKYAICQNRIPMVHYLTDMLPFVAAPWPETELGCTIGRNLKRSLEKNFSLPLLIRAKYATKAEWPKVKIPVEDHLNVSNVIAGFVKDHKYEKIWENEMFEILIPGKN
ncbi:MAG: glycosyltransferase family 39 protein [Candidatus Riflebacteria bacterium]|nr:glycosyltransferase family 39 protein [Candidatus Riflebacteria bacterium]